MKALKETAYDLTHVKQAVELSLFTRALKEPLRITQDSWASCKSHFMFDKEVKLVTHGWLSGGGAGICTSIRDEYLKQRDINVMIMNWDKIADNAVYAVSMELTKIIGDSYGDILNHIVDNGVQLDKMHLIGHSLGAHVSAFAARRIKKGKVARVTGLDPALPGFALSQHIKSSDGNFVDIIHTCAGALGLNAPVGHVDFYPNSGHPPQPGCLLILGNDEMITGSHSRAWEYFAASIDPKNNFMAFKCSSWAAYLFSFGKKGDTLMGDRVPLTARGTYYLKTTSKAPFALG